MKAVAEDLPAAPARDYADLLMWADMVASTPRVKCHLQSFAKVWQAGWRDIAASEWTPEDFVDLALTVLNAAAAIENPNHREALRAVCCLHNDGRALTLGQRLGNLLMEQHEGLEYRHARVIGQVAVLRARSERQWTKPLTLDWYARELRLSSRQCLYDKQWRGIIRDAERTLADWVKAGESALEGQLQWC